MKIILSILIIALNTTFASGRCGLDSLRNEIESYLTTKNAEVGVGILCIETGDTLAIGNQRKYPMQSVYKYHLALAVLDMVDKGELSLGQKIKINKKELIPNTWSPIREKYPDGNVELTLAELIQYTVAESDNIGCDILFRLIGGPRAVEKYIKSLGIGDISIKATEAEMHKSWKVQFTNWTCPLAAVQLLNKFYKEKILTPASYDFLWNTMLNTTTGPKRIRGLLPKGTRVANKTGSSGTNSKGMSAATNDIGIVTLPDGSHFAIAVFVSNSKENHETNEKIIAEITKMVWDCMVEK